MYKFFAPTHDKYFVPEKCSCGMTPYLGFCSFFFIIGSSFLYGYNVGDLNTPAAIINETFFVVTYSKRQGKTPETADHDLGILTIGLWQVTIALFVAGGAVGSLGKNVLTLDQYITNTTTSAATFITTSTGSSFPNGK